MKKFQFVLMIMILVSMVCFISGCGQKSDEGKDSNQKTEEKSVARTLAQQFKEEIKKEKDIMNVASSISKNKVLEISTDVVALGSDDYVSGFQTEIKKFNQAVAIRPMIGTIPFVAYIFDVDDGETFAKNLKENADLRWNICTEADEMEAAVFDHYVFFVMSPKNFDQE